MGKIVFMHCDLDSSDGRTVEGITLVVDGDVKTVLDYILMEKANLIKIFPRESERDETQKKIKALKFI